MRLRLALTCLATAATPLVVATPAHATPCQTATRTVTGWLGGEDGRIVDALIGFEAFDRYNRRLDATPGGATFGCTGKSGYSMTLRLNRNVPATGALSGGVKTWSIKVPASTTSMFMEIYPQGAGDTGTNESRYAHAMRRKIPIPYGKSINTKLPVVCPAGGRAGKIQGVVTKRGVRVKADRVAAWSMATDNNTAQPILGWNVGTASTTGTYQIPNLASNQYYTVQIRKDGVLKQSYKIYVYPCKATTLNAAF